MNHNWNPSLLILHLLNFNCCSPLTVATHAVPCACATAILPCRHVWLPTGYDGKTMRNRPRKPYGVRPTLPLCLSQLFQVSVSDYSILCLADNFSLLVSSVLLVDRCYSCTERMWWKMRLKRVGDWLKQLWMPSSVCLQPKTLLARLYSCLDPLPNYREKSLWVVC